MTIVGTPCSAVQRLATPVTVPFRLLRPVAQLSKAGEEFLQFARCLGG
jgi:hypothetical protein